MYPPGGRNQLRPRLSQALTVNEKILDDSLQRTCILFGKRSGKLYSLKVTVKTLKDDFDIEIVILVKREALRENVFSCFFFLFEGKGIKLLTLLLAFVALSSCCLSKVVTQSSLLFNCDLILSYRLLLTDNCQSLEKRIWAKAGLKRFLDFYLVLQELIPYVKGREFIIPSLAHRFIAEMVDFFILFFIKATIVLSIMHLSGIKDISKFAMHYIIEEIDEDTSMEDLQKMMIVALIYRLLVCFYEIICIWGAGGATPGKFLLGLRVVTCDTSVLIAPSRVLVIPSSNVSMTTSTIRALIKNFSIASFFPAFITLLFFQHNRTAYDIVAGTIVVRRNGVR
ncbi:protein FAM8A1 [Egretta garzetta]|uniref:protein FAM8A1 n=1 Tax=Egretta garzetta TaxID=188379 RepID=UPI00163C94B2|nr:protein FAM8A1 [Egretta garzetta]